jgi:hypothetical protein
MQTAVDGLTQTSEEIHNYTAELTLAKGMWAAAKFRIVKTEI